jgi:DNA-binding GntR family transcriptional regulator
MAYESKADVVARELRRMIDSGEMPPGQVLRQRQLAQLFNVSATPVREALQRLEALGYISSELHRGASVVRHDFERDRENSLIRSVLEPLASAWAAERCTAEDYADILALHREYEEAIESGDLGDVNRRFHMRIYDVAGSPLLVGLIRQLWNTVQTRPDRESARAVSLPAHRELLNALKQRDAETAALVTKRHILAGIRYIPFTQETIGYVPRGTSGPALEVAP